MEKVIKHIGELNGRVLLFGGVYSNLHALEALHAIAIDQSIEASNIICTGDIVAYCAYPAECVAFTQKWGIHTIAGNVELNLLDQSDDCGCNFDEGSRCDVFSKQWYPYAQSKMQKSHLDFLSTIPHHIQFAYNKKKVTVLHGTDENVSGYVFKSTSWSEKKKILDNVESDIVVAGHCGVPFIDKADDKIWINAGVIGMPANDGHTHTWYAILDIEDDIKVNYHKLNYAHQIASQAMKDIDLIPAYAKTLVSGLWDNCDVLPAHETAQQGKRIDLSDKIMTL